MPAGDPLASAIDAAAEASERYVSARSDLMHRLADIDGAVVELVQRVFDSTPAEFQRTFHLRAEGAAEEELSLPDFFRWLMERPDGTRATFTISVHENLYDDTDADDEDAAAPDPDDDDLEF